jgi:5-methyltetrahydropteroyltriglutamate--homocysteine methyltransferase
VKHSTDRILTTHVGSLIRPQSVVDHLRAKQADQKVDEASYQAKLKEEVKAVVICPAMVSSVRAFPGRNM